MSEGISIQTVAAEADGLEKVNLVYQDIGVRVIANLSTEKIAYCSATFEQLTGYTPKFLVRSGLQKLFQIIHPKDRFDYQLYLHRFCRNSDHKRHKKNIGKQFRIIPKNGKSFNLWQVTEDFEYEGEDMLLIHLKKHDPRIHNSTKHKAYISVRELEVLRLLGSGFSSKEIAEKLCISDHTAISHRKNLIEKFRARNTAHLIREAFRLIDI